MIALPIALVLPELTRALADHAAVVLQAPPGAGKSTMVPLALLDQPWLGDGRIVMLEPRRLAARAVAARMASLRQEAIGEAVGFRVRFESRVGPGTRIEVVTEGILTRRLQSDPGLDGVSLVIFDEFHERHLHTDLALALTLDCQRHLREDLKILVMSATLDSGPIAALLGNAPVIASQGRGFPVEVRYAPRDVDGPVPPLVSRTIVRALAQHDGDVLVFLPGAGEIRRTHELLDSVDADVLPLYGDLPWDEQDRAIRPSRGRRKVVLATPIAETSLTIEGIRVVVDAGLVRAPELDPQSGLTRLVTQRISQASSEQRAGRAGRLGPGVCYRLWTEGTQHALLPFAVPEIRSADLAPLALELASWGVSDPGSLTWLDPPPPSAFAQARALLGELGAVDESGRITAAGRAMAALPLHPRLAHMLDAARPLGLVALACDLAALLSERDVLAGDTRRSCDIGERVAALHALRANGRHGARGHGADPAACQRVDRASAQLRRIAGAGTPASEAGDDDIGLLLALAYPDRVALCRAPGDMRYVLASGRGARLPERETSLRAPCLVAASLDAGDSEGVIHLAAPLAIDMLRTHLGARIRTEDVVRWDAQREAVTAERVERFGKLVLGTRPLRDIAPEARIAALLHGIRGRGVAALPWTDAARSLQARVLSMRAWFPDEGWPDMSDAALLVDLESWLAPFLDRAWRRDDIDRIDLCAALEARLDWRRRARLDQAAPTHITVPSGGRRRLEYTPGASPVLAVKLQEMFGLADTPRVAGNAVPVTLHLLSPAGRPIQVTQDLKSFWNGTYAEVKKELRGRYPRHPWPDDPWSAAPTARTRRGQR